MARPVAAPAVSSLARAIARRSLSRPSLGLALGLRFAAGSGALASRLPLPTEASELECVPVALVLVPSLWALRGARGGAAAEVEGRTETATAVAAGGSAADGGSGVERA